MAKELPYFKFEPSEWENGLIQMCSRESKGLFIDIISIYWQRLGDLPYRYVLQKLCNGNADALKELTDENILKIDDGNIIIHFLDNQLKEFNLKSKKATDAANARWGKHNENGTLDADAMQTHSEGNAIREEKSRVDKKKREKDFDLFWDKYAKKTGKEKSRKKFLSLKDSEIEKILQVVEQYVKSTPDEKYRKNPLTWLNGKHWEDETIKKPVNGVGRTNQPILVYKDEYSNEKADVVWKS